MSLFRDLTLERSNSKKWIFLLSLIFICNATRKRFEIDLVNSQDLSTKLPKIIVAKRSIFELLLILLKDSLIKQIPKNYPYSLISHSLIAN